ncbi:transposase [Pseudocolwellia sp. AS88]|uniref:transposase n=1 Tax=Pseudocolwellia sp. AS88 TaxID=3063958 RepID=UPI0034E93D3E
MSIVISILCLVTAIIKNLCISILPQRFSNLHSYTRVLYVMPRVIPSMVAYFILLKSKPKGIEFIDSTTLEVSHNIRITQHKIFARIIYQNEFKVYY